MGASFSQQESGGKSPDHAGTKGSCTKHFSGEKKKKHSKLNTIKRKIWMYRTVKGVKTPDYAKEIRDLTLNWDTQELSGVVEEYESLAALKELTIQTNLARPLSSTLKKDMSSLYDGQFCSDVVLVYGGVHFPVHRALLSARCPYLREILTKNPEHKADVEIELKTEGVGVEMFSLLLRYLYTGEFDPNEAVSDYLDIVLKLGEEFGTPNVLEQDMKVLLSTAEFSDIVLVFPSTAQKSELAGDLETCAESPYEVPCHKAVLCARSPYFQSLLLGQSSRSLNLSDHNDPQRIVIDESVIPRQYTRVILQCMYLDFVDLSSVVRWSTSLETESGVEAHQLLTTTEIAMEMYEIARFIDFPVLAQGCEDIIAEELSLTSLIKVLQWSSQPHGSEWVHRQALQFIQEEFTTIASSAVLTQLPRNYFLMAVKSDFLQASEHDVLAAVLKWGEAQVVKKLEGKEKESFYSSSSKRSGRRREIDTIALKSVLSGIIEHVRVGYILPPNSDLLLNALRQRLLHKPVMDLDVASSSSRQISPWLQSRHERSYTKPRLFTPYFEEAKAVLADKMVAEMELVDLRMLRLTGMPDTLYMVKPTDLEPANPEKSSSLPSVIANTIPCPDPDTVRAMLRREKELKSCNQIQKAYALTMGDHGAVSHEVRKRVVREFGLPDIAVEVLSSAPKDLSDECDDQEEQESHQSELTDSLGKNSSGDSMPDVAKETASLQSEAGAGTFMSCLDLLEDEPATSDT